LTTCVRRTHQQRAEFDRLLSKADVFYGTAVVVPTALEAGKWWRRWPGG
jgi:hypothetical protein